VLSSGATAVVDTYGIVRRFIRGETVVARYPLEQRMARCYQVIIGDPVVNVVGWPHVVLDDSDNRVALYMPEGTPLWRWNVVEGRFREPRMTQGESICRERCSGPAPRDH
jgi:hypothetical protein